MLPNSWFPTKEIIYAEIDDIANWELIEVLIFREINKYRVENGLKPVKPEVNSKRESDIRTAYMLEVQHMSHDYFSVSSRRLKDLGFKSVAENIAHGYKSAESVMNAWKNSPGHNSTILTSRYEYVGVSVDGINKHPFFCTMFTR